MPPSPTAHSQPLGHVSIGVRSGAASEAFYTAALAPLGLILVYDAPDPTGRRVLGYGTSADAEILTLFERGDSAQPPGPGCHIAFNAANRAAVAAFHEIAVRPGSGGRDDGAPGLRPHYGEHYFAAFVIDPDGYRLEAVCQEPEAKLKPAAVSEL